ncbi:hypothetical protein LAZ67_5001924 [Cordylochernes scorpioides]|uniref:Carboxylesterase type B domain-containing protein n=1 Tax=Cordylochernes scorpioides TaxID=51811 RepID=A0ABY6KG08_9ARAC|nr:hypothetical protein LAZ67_5001924 [Cordylochernes scorpioides]
MSHITSFGNSDKSQLSKVTSVWQRVEFLIKAGDYEVLLRIMFSIYHRLCVFTGVINIIAAHGDVIVVSMNYRVGAMGFFSGGTRDEP